MKPLAPDLISKATAAIQRQGKAVPGGHKVFAANGNPRDCRPSNLRVVFTGWP